MQEEAIVEEKEEEEFDIEQLLLNSDLEMQD